MVHQGQDSLILYCLGMEDDLLELIKLRTINESQLQSASWAECNKPHQLFYNEDSNKFILNDFKNLTIFNKIITEKFDAAIKGPVEFLSYSQDRSAIVYLAEKQGGLIVRHLMNQTDIKIKEAKEIVHIEWLGKECQADIIIVEESGIRFIKLQEDKKGYKELKYVSTKTSACWFEWRTETLVTCSFYERGVLNIFTFKDPKNKSLYKTGTLQLVFKEDFVLHKKGDKNLKFKVASTRSHQPLFCKIPSDSFQIQLLNVYEVPTIAVLNLMAGLLDFYHIQGTEGNKLDLAVNLPTDSPAILTVYDSLVLIHLKNDHISFVYDIKRSGTQPVATPAAIGSQEIYNSQILNRWILTANKQVYKWDLQPEAIFRYIKNDGEVFLFLMRRRNTKMIILKWIREHIFEFKATVISSFLKIIFVEHSDSIKSGDKMFIEQSISPTDVYANIIYPLQNTEHKERLLDIMLETQRELSTNKLETPPKFQQLVIQSLLKARKQLLLSQLIQSRLIEQSKQLALQLYQHSSKSDKKEVLIQIVVDILYRKGCKKELLTVFADLGYFSQIIKVVRKHHQDLPLEILIDLYKNTNNEHKEKLKVVLKDLGRELYPITEQFVVAEIEKIETAS